MRLANGSNTAQKAGGCWRNPNATRAAAPTAHLILGSQLAGRRLDARLLRLQRRLQLTVGAPQGCEAHVLCAYGLVVSVSWWVD